jgi:hypothetical protein
MHRQEATAGSSSNGRYAKALAIIFLFTLPLVNPWVRGDGVGYYAIARSMLIEHRLDFTQDWLRANTSFRMGRLDASGQILPGQYTSTGHLVNHFSVGPAILWAPFLIVANVGVHLADWAGAQIPADGFSKPYIVAMALGTACYGFLAILLSFSLARRYVQGKWAFLACLGIWFGSSLPVYMYFNPSWSHAHSAFVVALFVWYWDRTREQRDTKEWAILGAIGGLMVDTYLLNVALLVVPFLESIANYVSNYRVGNSRELVRLFGRNVIFVGALIAAFLPTLFVKKIIYGSYLASGYEHLWVWTSPFWLKVCFSADHGVFSWHPILLLALTGLILLYPTDRRMAKYCLLVFALFIYTIGSYEDWDGLSSFGNRFFVSLTPVFILGLAVFCARLGTFIHERRVSVLASCGVAIFVLWNLGLVFQWGMHLIPEREAISWRTAAYNQFAVVPRDAASALKNYLTGRAKLMERIERQDVNQLKSHGASDDTQ